MTHTRITRGSDETRIAISQPGPRGIQSSIIIAPFLVGVACVILIYTVLHHSADASLLAAIGVILTLFELLLIGGVLASARSSGSVRISADSMTIYERRLFSHRTTSKLSALMDVMVVRKKGSFGIVVLISNSRPRVFFKGRKERGLNQLLADIREEIDHWRKIVVKDISVAVGRSEIIADFPPMSIWKAGGGWVRNFTIFALVAFCISVVFEILLRSHVRMSACLRKQRRIFSFI